MSVTTTPLINLANLNVHFVVDRSTSMNEPLGSLSRWNYSREAMQGLVTEIGKHDDDGIDITFFNGAMLKEVGVKPDRFVELWKTVQPAGGTKLAPALGYALDLALERIRKTNGEKQEFIAVLLDGELDAEDGNATAQYIVNATKQIKNRSQLGILFLQVGNDPKAKAALTRLDNDLGRLGASHDIVSSKNIDEVNTLTPQQLVDAAFSQ